MLDLHMKDARAVTPCEVFLVGGCSVRRSAVLSVPVVVHTSYARVSFTPSCLILHEYTLFATGGGSVAVGSTWKRGIGSDRSEACSPTKLPPSRGRETDEESKRSDFRGRGAGFCEMVLSAISTRLSHLALCYRRSSEILRLSSWWTMTISSRLKSDSATGWVGSDGAPERAARAIFVRVGDGRVRMGGLRPADGTRAKIVAIAVFFTPVMGASSESAPYRHTRSITVGI
ncbi:hypothetical protein BZA05DRAFT_410221 [Tricharina praecox]|uniref:uncharacterized protein n=1 Tax=Tricharina praecox TaxID=43433 RepID=UPI0022210B89|nr:uncharacterized protein BZA05DRAFT_410221 [Tricharina praecox]KAI5844202.1 hypothetical protein BZA05DRAFT_410221 [Tricharina praecox]